MSRFADLELDLEGLEPPTPIKESPKQDVKPLVEIRFDPRVHVGSVEFRSNDGKLNVTLWVVQLKGGSARYMCITKPDGSQPLALGSADRFGVLPLPQFIADASVRFLCDLITNPSQHPHIRCTGFWIRPNFDA